MIPPLNAEGYADLALLTEEEWPVYFFDWLHHGEWTEDGDYFSGAASDPVRVLNGIRSVCLDFGEIGARYSLKDVGLGFWAIWSEMRLGELLFRREIPWEVREQTIRAMAVPYRDFLAGHPAPVMEDCFFMWWHIIRCPPRSGWVPLPEDEGYASELAEAFGVSAKDVARVTRWSLIEEDQTRLRQTYFETLSEILALDDVRCQEAALHGLGHLDHPERQDLIEKFIDRHPEWKDNPDSRAWAERCADGTVM